MGEMASFAIGSAGALGPGDGAGGRIGGGQPSGGAFNAPLGGKATGTPPTNLLDASVTEPGPALGV